MGRCGLICEINVYSMLYLRIFCIIYYHWLHGCAAEVHSAPRMGIHGEEEGKQRPLTLIMMLVAPLKFRPVSFSTTMW